MATDPPGTDVAVVPAPGPTSVELADRAMQRRASQLSKAVGLLPKALHNKPAEVYLILVKAAGLGIPEGEALANFYVIEGRLVPSAQLQAALIRRAGHELTITEITRERCVVKARRRGVADWLVVEYGIEDARDSGLVDVWVEKRTQVGTWKDGNPRYDTEKFVVGNDLGIFSEATREAEYLPPMPEWAKTELKAGRLKRKDNWWRYRRDMLRARCIAFIGRSEFSDCLLGIGFRVDWSDEEVDRAETRAQAHKRHEPEPAFEDDIEDAEIVEPTAPAEAPAEATAEPEPEPEPSADPSATAAGDGQPDQLQWAPGEEPFG